MAAISYLHFQAAYYILGYSCKWYFPYGRLSSCHEVVSKLYLHYQPVTARIIIQHCESNRLEKRSELAIVCSLR